MYYYLFEKDGTVYGFLQSETTVNLPYSVMVTEEAYKKAGGHTFELSLPDPTSELKEALDILTGGKDDELGAISES